MKRIRLKWLKKHRFTERGFRPYVLAIGQLALAWNDLHEKLGMMFVTLMGGGWVNLPAAVWQSAHFDRPKREMLRAAILNQTAKFEAHYPTLKDDLLYVLGQCETIEEARNNAVHSPLLLGTFGPLSAGLTGQWERVGKPYVFPDLLLSHPRARKLSSKKDLLAEFRWCRNATLVLRNYIVLIDHAMDARGRGGPWPDKPSLPNRGEKKTPKASRPRSHQKEP
jgi:hypothetical protein